MGACIGADCLMRVRTRYPDSGARQGFQRVAGTQAAAASGKLSAHIPQAINRMRPLDVEGSLQQNTVISV